MLVSVGFALLVLVPNLVLTRMHGLTRSSQVGLAVAIFTVVLVALPFTLRRLQRRHLL